MRILIYPQVLQPLLTTAMSGLDSPDIITHTGISQDDLMKLHFEHHARLIITRPDLSGMSCDRFVQVIRRNESVRKVSIMLLVTDVKQDIEHAHTCGANVILPLSTPAALLAHKIEELLDVLPRRPYRVVLNMTVRDGRKDKPILCNMENISSHGMLVRSTEDLALGDRINCSFFLPFGHRVSVAGIIVRTMTGADADHTHRYGIQFKNLSTEDNAAILFFVSQDKEPLPATGEPNKVGG